MSDVQMRFEALRLAHGALCSGKITASELFKYVQKNYEFLKESAPKKRASKRSK